MDFELEKFYLKNFRFNKDECSINLRIFYLDDQLLQLESDGSVYANQAVKTDDIIFSKKIFFFSFIYYNEARIFLSK